MSQFPLGLFTGTPYISRRIRYEPGDIFMLVTDGIVETGADRDADFGLERLAEMLRSLAREGLPEIAEAVQTAAASHGTQEDDQTILLVRPRPANGSEFFCAGQTIFDHAAWHKLFDRLEAELTVQ